MWAIFHQQLFKLAGKDLPEQGEAVPTMVFLHSSIADLRVLVNFQADALLFQAMRGKWEWGDVVKLSIEHRMMTAIYKNKDKAVSISVGEFSIFFEVMTLLEMPEPIIGLLKQAEGVKAFMGEFTFEKE